MITELVFFDLPKSTTKEKALELYRTTAGKWLSNPDLVEKYYFFDETKCLGGGVYIWKEKSAAEKWHGDEYKKMVESLYGSPPRIQIFEALIHVDPQSGDIREY